jgi:hypothetical protein
MVFLGRSKAEQYLGFIPFFSYINFILGYIPLALGDLWSQALLYIYIIYLAFISILNKFMEYITTNLFISIFVNNKKYINSGKKQDYTEKTITNSTKPKKPFLKTQNINYYTNLYNFSKKLNSFKCSIYNINYTLPLRCSSVFTNLKLPILNMKNNPINKFYNNYNTSNRFQINTELKYVSSTALTTVTNLHYSKNINLN